MTDTETIAHCVFNAGNKGYPTLHWKSREYSNICWHFILKYWKWKCFHLQIFQYSRDYRVGYPFFPALDIQCTGRNIMSLIWQHKQWCTNKTIKQDENMKCFKSSNLLMKNRETSSSSIYAAKNIVMKCSVRLTLIYWTNSVRKIE